MKHFLRSVMLTVLLPFSAWGDEGCREISAQGTKYTVCEFDPAKADIRLFLNDKDDQPYGHFHAINAALAEQGETLVFAMNAGMYHKNRSPVGHYVENRRDITPISTKPGPGNFHMLPNGLFVITEKTDEDGAGQRVQYRDAYVYETQDYLDSAHFVKSATQSGPMLVINGALHPRFIKGSKSRKLRNGVGRTQAGTIVFVISNAPVNFYDFAQVFKTDLKSDFALYLDGTISRLHAPELGRSDLGVRMGPIVGIVKKLPDALRAE